MTLPEGVACDNLKIYDPSRLEEQKLLPGTTVYLIIKLHISCFRIIIAGYGQHTAERTII